MLSHSGQQTPRGIVCSVDKFLFIQLQISLIKWNILLVDQIVISISKIAYMKPCFFYIWIDLTVTYRLNLSTTENIFCYHYEHLRYISIIKRRYICGLWLKLQYSGNEYWINFAQYQHHELFRGNISIYSITLYSSSLIDIFPRYSPCSISSTHSGDVIVGSCSNI